MTWPRVSDLVTWLAQVRIGRWRIPYNFIFVLMSALRYVPTVSREFDQTIDAQRARAVEFESYNIFNQMRNALPLFVPVLISSLVRAQDLTVALETRAFGASTERSFIRRVVWRNSDTIVSLLIIALTAAVVIAARRYNLGMLPYTPQRGF